MCTRIHFGVTSLPLHVQTQVKGLCILSQSMGICITMLYEGRIQFQELVRSFSIDNASSKFKAYLKTATTRHQGYIKICPRRNLDLSRLSKYLRSLQMTSNLSWRGYVVFISEEVNSSLHRLKFHKSALSTRIRITLIFSLIFLFIDYCCLAYNDLTAEQDIILQRIINCGIRFIYNLRRDEHITPYRRHFS